VVISKNDLNPEISGQVEAVCGDQGVLLLGKIPFNVMVVEAMVQGKSVPELPPEHELSNLILNMFNKIKSFS